MLLWFHQGSVKFCATLKLVYQNSETRFLSIGKTYVSKESWRMLEGSFSLSTVPNEVIFYLEGPPPGAQLLIKSVVILCSSSTVCDESKEKMEKAQMITTNNYFDAQSSKEDGKDSGNIILNHDFLYGLYLWHPNCCDAFVVPADHHKGLAAAIVTNLYQNSETKFLFIAKKSALKECWEILEGSFSLSTMPDQVIFYLEGPPAGTGLLIKSVVISCPSSTACDSSGTSSVSTDGDNIIVNPQFDDGLNSWSGRGCKVALHDSMEDGKSTPMSGKSFASATEHTQSWNGIQQDVTGRVKRKLAYEHPSHRQRLGGVARKFLLNCSPSQVVFLEGAPPGTDILLNSFVIKHSSKAPSPSQPVIEGTDFGVNIIINTNLTDGTNGWFPHGSCTMISDKIKLYLTYQVSAWVKIGQESGPQSVNVDLGVDCKWVNGGRVEISDFRWHEIGGSFRIEKQATKVVVYIQVPAAGVDLMVAGLQIFPVDKRARFRHLKRQTAKVNIPLINNLDNEDFNDFWTCINRTNLDNEDFNDFFI
ncbi:hypothetical protein HAX54_004793 [Datura stramonium]|uniref:CBM-cenC domain-containing protein n=1 Tax=Datura stramonium TaxID=4076 RepID=A0ABS8T7J8_DATST|nr:hypothetical protein [Datura stramonium]